MNMFSNNQKLNWYASKIDFICISFPIFMLNFIYEEDMPVCVFRINFEPTEILSQTFALIPPPPAIPWGSWERKNIE